MPKQHIKKVLNLNNQFHTHILQYVGIKKRKHNNIFITLSYHSNQLEGYFKNDNQMPESTQFHVTS